MREREHESERERKKTREKRMKKEGGFYRPLSSSIPFHPSSEVEIRYRD